MAEDVLYQLVKQAETLTLNEQLQLMAHIEKMIRQHNKADINLYLWGEIQTHREKIIKLAGLHGASNIRVTNLGISNHTPLKKVNFLVNLEPGRSLLDLAGLMVDLQALLGCEVYVTEEGGLKGDYRERVLKEAISL